MIPYGKQSISQEDINSVVEVLKSDFLTQGPKINEFENAISKYVNSKYCIAVNSATSALHIGCLALGVGPGDIVWTAPNSFVASSNAALYCGASVDFVDIDLETNNLCCDSLESKLIEAKANDILPKVVIPVHLGGLSCDIKRINSLSKEYGFKILEDASHCIGGDYENAKIGSCLLSDLCVFSFHPVKIITTGEGGAITTNSSELYSKLVKLRTHGITKNIKEFNESIIPDWYYQQQELGFNYRITDIQAALGITQLKKLDFFISKRRSIVEFYQKNLSANFDFIDVKKNKGSSNHLFILKIDHRDEVREALLRKNIFTNLHYFPIHLQPFYLKLGFKEGDFPNSEIYGKRALSIPVYPDLNQEDLDYIVETLNDLL